MDERSGAVRAAAPGKLSVLGEFGVSEGGPALVAAVDRYAVATLRDRPGGSTTLLAAPGMGIEATELPAEGGGELLAFLSATVQCVQGYLESRNRPVPTVAIEVQATGVEGRPGLEVGFGATSAAAVAVAAAYFLRSGLPVDTPAERWDLLALTAYARSHVFGGLASGADVAAAVHGGILAYRKGGECRRLAFPEGLLWRVVHRPGEKRTGSMIWPVAGKEGEEGGRRLLGLAELARIAGEAVLALEGGNLAGFFASIRAYGEGVGRLEAESHASLVPPVLRRLAAAAAARGGAFKPVAGALGELGIAFAPDAATLEGIVSDCALEGLVGLDIDVDLGGVRRLGMTPSPAGGEGEAARGRGEER